MVSEPTAKLRISVWRDFVPSKALVFRGRDSPHQVLEGDTDLQQEIYRWQLKEDPFGGVNDEDLRARLRIKLFEIFEPSRPPGERRWSALKEFLDEAMAALGEGHAEWTASQDPPLDDDDELRYELNPLLALVLHLKWLSDMFSEQPGVSVSIR
jgi:hypothetical protein